VNTEGTIERRQRQLLVKRGGSGGSHYDCIAAKRPVL
jgi:hypothetical protein